MTLDVYADAVEQREPGIAKRCAFRCDDIVAELDASAAAS